MSFILDALKKAESERSRNSGPVLMDVRIAPSRQRLPLWAWALGFVLLANLLLLGWLVLRKPAATPSAVSVASTAVPAPAAAIPVATAPAPAAAPATMMAAPAPALPATEVPPATPPAALPAPVALATPALPPAPVDNLPTLQEVLASGMVLPQLQLVLHVYDEVPANRYVLLNSRRLREGEELSDGIRIERITSRGVVIDARGRRFLLPAGG